MKLFEVMYEVGPHDYASLPITASNITSARKKADREIRVYKNPIFSDIRELSPVPRLEHERELRKRDQRISDLQNKLRSIQEIING